MSTSGSSFTLLIAPPGKGKTSFIIDFYQKTNMKMVYLSPLKALSLEFYKRVKELRGTYYLKSSQEVTENIPKFLNFEKGLLILSPEVLFYSLESLFGKDILIIFDEFHLFYYWGQTFRPLLMEVFMGLAFAESTSIALSATVDKNLLEQMKADLLNNYKEINILNYGNQRLSSMPSESISFNYLGKKYFNRFFVKTLSSKPKNDTYLYFCRYRSEVDRWLEICERKGINAVGCVGGMSENFSKEVEKNIPSCIFATTALSHGVNLPSIKKVFINYEVLSKDFWIQMCSRAGRKEEVYQIYSFDSFLLSPLKNHINTMRFYLRNLLKGVF